MPAMEVIIRETLRLTLSNAALRRNVADDLMIDGKIVPRGDFLAYSIADAHLNPEIYADPMSFDPARFGPEREEDKKGGEVQMGQTNVSRYDERGAGSQFCQDFPFTIGVALLVEMCLNIRDVLRPSLQWVTGIG